MKSTTYFLLIASFVLAAGVATAYYYRTQIMDTFGKNFKEAKNSHQSADYDSAIEAFKEAQKESPDKFAEAKIRSLMAFNLFSRNQPGDREEAMRIYKLIINDFSIPAPIRALVINDVAMLLPNDEQFIRKNLNQEPFVSFLGTSTPFDISKFKEAMFEYSDEIFPNSLAKFNIVNIRTIEMGAGTIAGEEKLREAATFLQDYIKEGDKLFTELAYEPSHRLRQHLFRAVGFQAVGAVLKSEPSLEEREEAFKKATTEALKYDDYQSKSVAGMIRFFHANFLQRSFGESRTADIVALLTPFSIEENSILRSFFAPTGTNRYVKESAMRLAKISSEFKNYLIKIGWSL